MPGVLVSLLLAHEAIARGAAGAAPWAKISLACVLSAPCTGGGSVDKGQMGGNVLAGK